MKEAEEAKTPIPEKNSATLLAREESPLNIRNLISILVINWKWFFFSIIVCVGVAYTYLRFTTPIYQASAKLLLKEEDNSRRNSIKNTSTLGIVSNSEGIDNELEILKSRTIAEDIVKRLRLYTSYKAVGRVVDRTLYKNQPITVDLDQESLEKLQAPINLTISYNDGKYTVKGNYVIIRNNDKGNESRDINVTLPVVPTRIKTDVGYLTFMTNDATTSHMANGDEERVVIMPVNMAVNNYVGRLSTSQYSKTTSIALLVFTDDNIERAKDYLAQLATSYNDEANNDKNTIAARTEEFINSRLEKINKELGMTEGQIESFKRENNVVDFGSNAQNAYSQSNTYDQQLAEMTTQVTLLNSISEYMSEPQNKYQTLPSNVGLTDQAATSLINSYNQIALERNRLLRTANENSPSVIPLTEQLNDLTASIRRAISQTQNNYRIRRNAMESQFSKFNAKVQQSPTQERILNEIGRQQEVRSGLYLMLLQKREENSISLASTADKGKLIDQPGFAGQIAPNESKIMGIALLIGVLLPLVIFILIQFMRYRIEGRADVERLTNMPVIGDIPVANEAAKTTADIVVHENQNNMMEEVFRSLRTNIQFSLKEGQKVVLFTSETSGEGKTFIAANTAVSFALLGKKVVLVGLDIRKPRLTELFKIDDKGYGITKLLMHEDPTKDMVKAEIIDSGVNDNLDLLPAGPVPPNPAEIITRQSLDKTFAVLREMYDYVIIDTAPVGLVTDTISAARVADITVFVCRADYTAKSAFGYFNELADSEKVPNPSVVVNAVDLSKKKYGYYYGYGKYGKYGRYGKYGYKRYNGYGGYSGYGSYGSYGRYGRYGRYGHYGSYGNYGMYGNYTSSRYGSKNDKSIKK